MNRTSYRQPSPRTLQVLHAVLLVLWGITFLAAHWLVVIFYLVPILALITFFLLPPFPLVLAGLFLSGYAGVLPADQMPETPKLLLIGAIWCAALVALGAKAWIHRPRTIPAQPEPEEPASSPKGLAVPASPISEPSSTVSFDIRRSRNVRHDINTPVNLILAFCESLLMPFSPNRPPLPEPFREDVEAIYRNARQLKALIEQWFDNPASFQGDEHTTDSTESRPPKKVIILDERGAAFELFRQYLPQYELVRVSSVVTIGRLPQDSNLLAVAISSDDYAQIPVVAQLVGNTIPILWFNLAEAQPQTPFHGAADYLAKPVRFEALRAALERTGAALHSVLIIDDSRDNVQMLSLMLNSLPDPPALLKAYSGREALAILREETPDVILLDFVLSDMDGMAILDYLQMEVRLAHIPVLLVSSHHLPDIEPVPGVTRLTLFNLAGLSPAHLARYFEGLLAASAPQPRADT